MLSRGNQTVAEVVADEKESLGTRIKSWLLAHWVPVTIFVTTFILFSPALRNSLLNWDDPDNFSFNQNFRGFRWSNLKWMWTSFHLGPYQPLSWMSLALNYVIWGEDAEGHLYTGGYYLGNILLHSLNVLLVYRIAIRLLRCARGVPATAAPNGECGTIPAPEDRTLQLCAAFGAFLFGWHPLRVESVAWATERRDVLSAAFLLGSVIWYLRMAEASVTESDTSSRQRRRAYHISWSLYIAALLSKAMGMTLPAVLLLIDLYPLRRLPANPRDWFMTATGRRLLARRLLEKIPYMLASAICMVLAVYGQRHFAGLRTGGEYPLSARLAQCQYGLAWYLRKLFWPSGLCTLYPLEIPPKLSDPECWISGVAMLLLLLVLWCLRRRLPSAITAFCAYGILISPLLGLAQSGPQIVADRFSYLPSIPWAIFFAGALWWWLVPEISPASSSSPDDAAPSSPEDLHPLRFKLARAGGPIIMVVLGGLTLWHLTFWIGSRSLWTRVLEVSDFNPIAHHNLALVIAEPGKMEVAFMHLQKAIEQRPYYLDAYLNYGILLEQEKRREEAADILRKACQVFPNSNAAYYNLALVLAAKGDAAGAEAAIDRAIQISPHEEANYRNAVKDATIRGQNERHPGSVPPRGPEF